MPGKDSKGDKEMPNVNEQKQNFGEVETRVHVKDGVIVLDRNNPIHRMWMEEDDE